MNQQVSDTLGCEEKLQDAEYWQLVKTELVEIVPPRAVLQGLGKRAAAN
jgi:hypothetical protein